jgi:hypothetical protein
MPFLADPQVGAWYPLNWPFFLLGITPKAMEWEMALHCLIAAIGAFLLARDLLGSRWAASFCAVFYALSGFFAGHSSHTGIFQAASLPGLELTAASDRASSNYSRNADAVVPPGALLTLVSPDHFGAPEVQNYTGPSDVTQFFWYQGFLLLPPAAAGLALSNRRWYALL